MKPIDEKTIETLITAAREVQSRAHAPYSRFHVGAALLTESGEIVTGCNVENASYGLTICAERSAITRSVAQGSGRPVACLVVGPTEGPLTPCGACRQVLHEFNPEMAIICVGKNGSKIVRTAAELLPYSFGSQDLDAAAKG
ncbi:cytidine deaminase [bacterium]|nr:cytidine deaminase [bacterium]